MVFMSEKPWYGVPPVTTEPEAFFQPLLHGAGRPYPVAFADSSSYATLRFPGNRVFCS